MEQKKIATAVDIMIKVADYEYIHITKYAEKNISYENKEEMVDKEDELSIELVNDIVRTMRKIPDQLGKKTEAVAQIEEKIQTRIPEWLENNPIPNIANTAKQNHEKVEAEVHAEANEKKGVVKEDVALAKDLFDEPIIKLESVEVPVIAQEISTSTTEVKPEESSKKKQDADFDDDLFADDSDLFDNK